MPKMFGFSRRRTKLGRLKVHLGDPAQATRSPFRPLKRSDRSNVDNAAGPTRGLLADELNSDCSPQAFDLDSCNPGSWTVMATSGNKPEPRSLHGAAVVGNKMVVVGGESSANELLNDTMILRLDKLSWANAVPKGYIASGDLVWKLPACKGHSLVSWEKSVLLIGGKTEPVSERLSIWSFDVEMERWSCVEAKGDIPVARSGHSVVRAGSNLILFGGEDAKGRKLNDLHMFDLKSLTWLPLLYNGTRPSARSNHVATLYDDRILLVFGGQSKSKILNDLYSLDFETMVWSRIKIRGRHPSPRAGCRGALCGTKWYIAGGGSNKKRYSETYTFDVAKLEWSTPAASPSSTVITNKGFSLVSVNHKDKTSLVAFGGNKKEPSNQVEILTMLRNDSSLNWQSVPDKHPISLEKCLLNAKELNGAPICLSSSVARHSLASATDQNVSGRKSLSDSSSDANCLSGSVSLRKQFDSEEDHSFARKLQKTSEDEKVKYNCDDYSIPKNSLSQAIEQQNKQQAALPQVDIARILSCAEENPFAIESDSAYQKHDTPNMVLQGSHTISDDDNVGSRTVTNPSNISHLFEAKIASLVRRNHLLEEQLGIALANQETAEKNLSSATKGQKDAERKLAETVKEVEILKEKLAGLELAHEEASNLSNIVHSDNLRLEHDVAFLKAVLEDTQKELHSTRGVLAGERARAFQLQVEVFHLKQKLQSVESRVPTIRKPFHA